MADMSPEAEKMFTEGGASKEDDPYILSVIMRELKRLSVRAKSLEARVAELEARAAKESP